MVRTEPDRRTVLSSSRWPHPRMHGMDVMISRLSIGVREGSGRFGRRRTRARKPAGIDRSRTRGKGSRLERMVSRRGVDHG